MWWDAMCLVVSLCLVRLEYIVCKLESSDLNLKMGVSSTKNVLGDINQRKYPSQLFDLF